VPNTTSLIVSLSSEVLQDCSWNPLLIVGSWKAGKEKWDGNGKQE